jgi:hypothetical protein
MPNNLLVSPCDGIPAGDTVRSLAKGYVANTTCLEQHKRLLDSQREYKKRIEALYNDTRK